MMPEPAAKPEPLALARGARGGGGEGWEEDARVGGAEALGAALLVLLSCLPGAPAGASGAVVAMLVQCFDHVSGAMFNPAVLLAALAWGGRVRVRRATVMLAAQLVGAALGAVALRALAPHAAAAAVTRPGAGVPPLAALAVEAAGGACLALANCAAWDARNLHLRDSWPLRIGATVTALSLVATELSGASFNPARSFGPALLAAAWHAHWVYWVGPLSGSLAATALYCAAWRPPAPRAIPALALPVSRC